MKNKLLLLFVCLSVVFTSCKDEDEAPRPVANFDFTACEAPCTVNFINISQNATSYNWNFGDGTTSTEVNPKHLYENAGTYNVTLQAAGEGGSHTREKQVVISPPSLYFKYKMDGLLIESQNFTASRDIPTGFMDIRSYQHLNNNPYLQFSIVEPPSGFTNNTTITLNQSSSGSGTIATFINGGNTYNTINDPTGITFNITEVNYIEGGIVSGTFSGTVMTFGGTVLITEGVFKMKFTN